MNSHACLPVRDCACSDCVRQLRPLSTSRHCNSGSQYLAALFRSRRTSERLPCPPVVTIPVFGFKIRGTSYAIKNVLAFYKASLCSAVRRTQPAGRRIFPTYKALKFVVELSLWSTSGRMSLENTEPHVLKFVSSVDSTFIEDSRPVNITQSPVILLKGFVRFKS